MARRSQVIWTFAITALALFMVTLDNLVVTTALPVIRHDLHANLQQLEWTINAYTLTFAVLLLTGAALGDRFGRRRIFSIGLVVFTLGSAGSALAQSPTMLIVARAIQGAGAAMVTPLTDRKSTRLNSSHANTSYAVFCLNTTKTLSFSSLSNKHRRNPNLYAKFTEKT